MERLVTNFLNATRLGPDSAAECRFRAVIGIDGVSFLVVHTRTNQVYALKSWYFAPEEADLALRRILSSELVVDYPFESQQIQVFNQQVTIVPKRMFSPEHLPAYFHLLIESQAAAYGYDDLPDQSVKVVYALESTLARQIDLYFPKKQKTHQATGLLSIWEQLSAPQDANVWLNLRNQSIQIAVFERQHLLFFNTYSFEKPNDVLYFVLLAYEQNRLKPDAVPLGLSGTVVEDSDLYRTLHRFIRTIHFAAWEVPFTLPADVQPHFYLDLLAL
jgi:Protein of unknown function (DUF3822)